MLDQHGFAVSASSTRISNASTTLGQHKITRSSWNPVSARTCGFESHLWYSNKHKGSRQFGVYLSFCADRA